MSFHFLNPAMLGLCILAPVLFLVMRRGASLRTRAVRQFGITRNFGQGWRRAASLAAVGCVIIALGRPSIGTTELTRSTNGDVVFLLDVSRSMLADDIQPSRLERAKQIISQAVSRLNVDDRVALVAFAGTQSIECALTVDMPFFQETLKLIGPDSVFRGGTRIGDAIRFAAHSAFDNVQRGQKHLVILTDGGDQQATSAAMVAEAAGRGIRITMVGIGGEADGAFVPASIVDRTPVRYHGEMVRTQLEATALRKLAAAARGDYRNANDPLILSNENGPPRQGAMETPLASVFAALACLLLLLEAFARRSSRSATMAAGLIASLIFNTCLPLDAATASVEDLAGRGLEEFRARRFRESVDAYEAAIKLSSKRPDLLYNLACAYYADGRYDQAQSAFAKAVVLAPKGSGLEVKARMGNANALYRQATVPKQTVPAKAMTDPPWQSKLVAAEAPEVLLWTALDDYKAALKIQPGLQDAIFNMAVVERRLKAIREERDRPGQSIAGRQDALSVIQKGKISPGRHQAALRQPVDQDW